MLTRDFLQKADCKTAFGIIDESLLLTPEQRRASLACTLSRRPDNSPVWIFGYGSLMWNPIFEAEEVRPATLFGWHRAFCLRLISGRGTSSQPGRMLALKEGGQTTGLAFRLPEDRLHEELELLWKREMLTGCYIPIWSELTLDNGDSVTALAFVMDPCHPFFEADTRLQVIAKKLNYGYTDFMSYSIDFRRRILAIKKHEGLSIRETAKRFHIGTTTIVRWTKQIDARPATSRQRKIDKSALERDVEQYPDAYQRERAERFGVCQMAICKALKKLQLTYKKNSASSKSRRRR